MQNAFYVDRKEIFLSCLEKSISLSKKYSATRISIRLILSNELYANKKIKSSIAAAKFKVEAIIPLPGMFSGLKLIYFGRNSQSRVTSKPLQFEQCKLLQKIFSTEKFCASEINRRLQKENIKIERLGGSEGLSKLDREMISLIMKQSLPVYQNYNFSKKLDKMIEAKDTFMIVVARKSNDGRIVGFCNLEFINVTIDSKVLKLAEFDHVAKFHNKETPSSISLYLRFALLKSAVQKGIDIVFSESRSQSSGINYSNYRLGMQYRGSVCQHIVIDGPSDLKTPKKEKYEDFHVWSISNFYIHRFLNN